MAPDALSELNRRVERLLAAQDQRYTAQRREIIAALARLRRPATIGELLQESSGVPLSTAYRNLTVLAEAQAVRRISGSDDLARFELAESLAGTHHHHHLLCELCGQVADATASARLEAALSEAAHTIAEANGFEVTDHRLELVGRCASCRRSLRQAPP